jgi:MFS family permease
VRSYQDNPRLLQWIAPFRVLALSGAYLVPFFLEKGLDQTDIFVLQSIFSLAYVLWEIPSGWVADRIGRARSIKLSLPFAVVSMVAYGLSGHYWQFVVCELLLAVASGLISGADEALLIDSLKAAGRKREYVRISQRINSLGFAATAVGVPASMALIHFFGVSATLVADGLLTAVSGVFSLRLVEPPVHEAEELDGTTTLQATKRLLGNKECRWLVALGVGLSTSTYIGAWLSAPYYTSIGVPVVAFGGILAARNLLKGWLGHRFHSEAHTKQLMAGHALLAGLPYVLMATGQFWLAWAVVGHDVVHALHSAPLSRRYNEHMPDRFRAMLNSVVRLQNRLVLVFVGPLAGLLVDWAGLSRGLLVLGLVFGSVAAVAYARLVRIGSFDKGR